MEPFKNYRGNGKQLLEPLVIQGTCRRDYGRIVLKECGGFCVYCGRNLTESYEAWLSLSVDHVIPISTRWVKDREDWIYNLINCVTCCRACNEFLNHYEVRDEMPETLEAFCDLRDNHFQRKKEKALGCHKRDKTFFLKEIKT
jgi:hypothetical protein